MIHSAGETAEAALAGIPKDYGNGTRNEYLNWVTPERTDTADTNNTRVQAVAETPATGDTCHRPHGVKAFLH